MDMSLYPHAVAMSADEFMTWSSAMIIKAIDIVAFFLKV